MAAIHQRLVGEVAWKILVGTFSSRMNLEIPKNNQLELAIEMKREFEDDHSGKIRPSDSVLFCEIVPKTLGCSQTTILRLVAMAIFRSSSNLPCSFSVLHLYFSPQGRWPFAIDL